MKKRYALGLILGLFFINYSAAYAQQKQIISLKKITSDNGLSSYYITKIIRDSKGFFWIGTQEGLSRYDGKNFITFSNQLDEKHRIGSTFISDIIEDKQRECIYALSSYGDIAVIDIKTSIVIKRITLDDKGQYLSEKWLRCLCLQQNILWIGTSTGFYAYDLNKDVYLKISLRHNLLNRTFDVAKISGDGAGVVWLFCDGFGVLIIDKKLTLSNEFIVSIRPNANEAEPKKLLFWDIAIHDTTMYAATNDGLKLFTKASNQVVISGFKKNSILDYSEIVCLAFSSENRLWVSSKGNFYSYDLITSKIIEYHEENKYDDWCSYIYQVYYDKITNSLWLGTQAGLAISSLNHGPFSTFYRSANSEEKIKLAYSLSVIDNSFAYCGDENGLYKINLLSHQINKIDDRSLYLSIFKDASNHIFVSNREGIFTINRENKVTDIKKSYSNLKDVSNDRLNCMVQYNDSLIAFGSFIRKGLHIWNTRSNSIITYRDSAKNNINGLTIINNLYKGKGERLFILAEKLIIEFDPISGSYKSHYINNENGKGVYNNFMDMCETKDSYWIGTYGSGLLETDKNFVIKKVYSTASQLCNNCIYKIFAIDSNRVVVTTNKGLGVINYKENIIKNYYKSDGLHGNEFQQYCGTQNNDKIYAGGVNGFTIIDPKYFIANNTPPAFYFTNIKTQTTGQTHDTSNLAIKDLKISSNWLQTNISFVGLNYSNPERVIYQYRIKERSSKWSEPNTQNFVTLMGLPPGAYTLEVKAANEDGVWCEPKTLTLTFLPKWYQTLWFDFAVALTVIGILYAFYRYRMRQLRKQHEIRVSIASDLHDDIGSALNTVKVFTHLAKRDTEKEGHLNQIEESLTQATIGLRDMLWILDDTQDTLHEIMERIKKFALPVTGANGINLECVTETEEGEGWVNKTKKRNLLLIAKESINNSIKYAQCQNIKVLLRQKKNKITLIIKDDGTGFNSNATVQGYGLKNIKNRAEQMGCTAEIISIEGEGTEVKVVSKS